MREGLRSSSKLLAKASKGEVLPSKPPANIEVSPTEENEVSKLVGFGFPKEEEAGLDRKDGSKESKEDNSFKKQMSKENDVLVGKEQVGRRVLRSMSAAKSQGKENNERGQINGGFVAERTRGKIGSEEKRVGVEKEESDHLHYSCQSDNLVNTKVEHTHGRSPKSEEIDEFEKKSGDIEKGEIEQSAGQEINQLNNELSEEIKCKHGMPPESEENDELEKICSVTEKGEIDQSAGQEVHHLSNKLSEESKRKRGRPPKYQKNDDFVEKCSEVDKQEIDQPTGPVSHQTNNKRSNKMKRKRGRPPKAQQCNEYEKNCGGVKEEAVDLTDIQESHQPNNEEINEVKPRRGRPPKAQKSNLFEKTRVEVKTEVCDQSASEEHNQPDNEARENLKKNLERSCKLNKVKMVGARKKKKRGRPSKDIIPDMNLNVGKKSSMLGKRVLCKDHNMKLSPAKKIKDINYEKEVQNTIHKAGEIAHRRSEKQAVRDKIVKLLLGAGWTIEYRPRNGREYMDAVYVNPEGRTHWSITLAYRVLKQHYEDGSGDSRTHDSSFKFTPISDEELSILTKVMVKERSDKNKKKRKWSKGEKGEKTTVAIKKKWKLNKRKLGAGAGVSHKMSKRRKKLKTTHGKRDDSAVSLGEGTAVSVKGCARLETHGRKRCSLMARKSQDGKESDKDGYVLYSGKRTMLAWMIDLGVVPLDGKVQYLKHRKTRAVTKGSITTDGIQCDCCNKTFTNAEFETHAGGKSCQPLENIYLETGPSLLQCQLDSWMKEDESARKGFHFVDTDGKDPNDDTCGICGDGGDLICCDSCPSTFHQSCLEIRKFPSGLWHCMHCLCKFCGMVGGNKFQKNDNKASLSHVLFTCHLCEDEYHQSCVQEKGIINSDPGNPSFCAKKCQELYKRLQMLFGVKHELEEGFSWTFVRRFDVGSDISLSGMSRKVDCNSKVAVALQIMDECFVPMVDHRSGVNLIRNIVYNFGSNFNRLNYSRFFTAILEKGDEMIAAASIRIHGNSVAEMPFIGTRYMYRRQGMCRRLLSAIEMALCSLNIEKLVIPAISQLIETWTSVFGFKPLEGFDKQVLKNMNMIMFPGVDMLQKTLLKHQFAEENMHPIEGSNSVEVEELHTLEDTKYNFDQRCSSGIDSKGSCETDVIRSGNITNEQAAVTSGSNLGCSSDICDITTQNASSKKPGDQSGVISDNLDVRNGMVNLPDSLCDDHDQTGDEMLDDSDKRYLTELDLNASSETGVPHVSNNIGEPAAAGSGFQHPDGSNVTTDITIEDVININCHDQCLISDNGEHNCDNTAEIISSQSQGLVSENGTKVSDQNAALWESKTTNISGNAAQSTSTEAHLRAQDSSYGSVAALSIGQNLSSMESNTQCMPSEVASGSCRVSGGGVYDLKNMSNRAKNGSISLLGGLVSDSVHMNTELSKPPVSDSKIDDAIQRNTESNCSSSPAAGVTLHCASAGCNSCGTSEVVILSNHAS